MKCFKLVIITLVAAFMLEPASALPAIKTRTGSVSNIYHHHFYDHRYWHRHHWV